MMCMMRNLYQQEGALSTRSAAYLPANRLVGPSAAPAN
jgi:hypothetical protein